MVLIIDSGLLTVGQSVDEAAFWFISLDKTCHAQLLVDAASAGSGHTPKRIRDEEAAFTYDQVGTPEKGWLVCIPFPFLPFFFLRRTELILKQAFQGYYDEQIAKTGGSFLE